jgi:clan AA aspartic protease (TIGR02281 family)
LGAGAIAALALVAAVWLRARPRTEVADASTEPPPPDSATLARLRARVDQEPCDRRRIVELAEQALREGNGREVVQRAGAFFERCGDYPRLRELRYGAYRQLSDWSSAAVEASKLIESDPYDASYRGWRGIIYESSGELARAAEDYEQALLLRPTLGDLPMNLAAAYEKLGKPCLAILPLTQVVTYYPEAANVGAIENRIARLAASGECAAYAGHGHAVVRRRPDGKVMTVRVRINGRDGGNFLVDTGATLVTLSRRTASALGLDVSRSPELFARTANGVAVGRRISLDEIAVQGVHAARVSAAVMDDLGGMDGLLGMSFLSRFAFRHANGVLEIDARAPSGVAKTP